ncbi:hypothetical protein [Spiroplasma tabanidicola]|uniref:Uncharacterized protein n=1 Tax=Spiroplasma tabanidicola TaxID=324079 RepID=A0A6I6C938_9MOLU|nr:hypothetical protein [Spiroplasma tabanidicola]QGS51979.1 hypothetical protein STABA_v1c06160 [Spiroplasma tabanidicola]
MEKYEIFSKYFSKDYLENSEMEKTYLDLNERISSSKNLVFLFGNGISINSVLKK